MACLYRIYLSIASGWIFDTTCVGGMMVVEVERERQRAVGQSVKSSCLLEACLPPAVSHPAWFDDKIRVRNDWRKQIHRLYYDYIIFCLSVVKSMVYMVFHFSRPVRRDQDTYNRCDSVGTACIGNPYTLTTGVYETHKFIPGAKRENSKMS